MTRSSSGGQLRAVASAPNEKKRADILHLAAIEFAERGYHATTVRDLSRAVGITQPGLYYHVGNKEQFLLSICESLLDWHIHAVADLADDTGPAAQRLRVFVERELATAAEHPAEIAVYLRERQMLSPALRRSLRPRQARLERLLRTILMDGARSSEFQYSSLDVTADAIWAILNAKSASIGRVAAPATPLAGYAEDVCTLLLDGLRRRPGP